MTSMTLTSRSLTSILAFMALVVLAVAQPARADENNPSFVLDKIKSSGVLKIPVMVGEEPGYIKDPGTGEWSGFYVDYLTDVADVLGVKVEPVETTFLVKKSGESFDDKMLDPEGLAATPWGTLLVSTEADLRQEPVEQAKLLEFDHAGRLVRGFTIPPKCVVEGES